MRSIFVLLIVGAVLATAHGASITDSNELGYMRKLHGTDDVQATAAAQKDQSVQRGNSFWGSLLGGYGSYNPYNRYYGYNNYNPYGGGYYNPYGGYYPSYGNSYAGASANAYANSGGPWGGNSYARADASAYAGSGGGFWGRRLHRKML